MLQTPYYLVDKSKLMRNMEKIAHLRELSGAKSLLALKCFATWGVFDFMAHYMDGTTSSSPVSYTHLTLPTTPYV